MYFGTQAMNKRAIVGTISSVCFLWFLAGEVRSDLLQPVGATASSEMEEYPASNAIDGIISNASRWVSRASHEPAWLEIDLGNSQHLAGVHVYSGFGNSAPINDFTFQFWRDGTWHDIPSATVSDNDSVARAVFFDDEVDVVTDRLRLWVTHSHQGIARVKEVVIWPYSAGVPILEQADAFAATPQSEIPLVYLNQSGFNFGKPKRFTAPTLPDGTAFSVRPADGGEALFEGVIHGQLGDFSSFNPTDDREYVVEAGGLRSVPFRIGPWWLERLTYQHSIDFLIDSRHYLGNYRDPCSGSWGWRDDVQYGWQLHTLVTQYLSNPSAYERMPRQVVYEAPSDPTLWGALEPYDPEAPDIVKLMHWAADVIVTQRLTHEMLKTQLAYFLYAWPWIGQYLPAQNYEVVRDFAFAHWSESTVDREYVSCFSPEHDLLALKTQIGTTKGGYPPGFSVEPNLLMFEVARREKRPDAEEYFNAAGRQVEWMISDLDWNDPLTTKGQRVSEFITMTGLAHFLREYPDRAPAGLAGKIAEWADVVIRRSDNMWDFRKLDDEDQWTPTGPRQTHWNEPGNVLGLPASLLAARETLADPAVRARLEQLVYSHLDNGFGRNPLGRHFSFTAPLEIEGVEHGWFRRHPGGTGQLAGVRFVMDGAPKNEHYPYHPEQGDVGWTEGWIQHNVPFNMSLAYLAYAGTEITLVRDGNEVVVRLRAPLNFEHDRVETGTVRIRVDGGAWQELTVTEESENSEYLSGRIQAAPGAHIEAEYGHGYMIRRAGTNLVPPEGEIVPAP
jgi:hypothetical protein